jgi:hypothetical protein
MADQPPERQPFVPRGAIAFFVAMIGLYLTLWITLYAVLVHRGG